MIRGVTGRRAAAVSFGAIILGALVFAFIYFAPDNRPYQEVIAQARLLDANGKSDKATAVINKKLRWDKNSDERVFLYMNLGTVCLSKQDWKCAEKNFGQAAKIRPMFGILEAYGDAANKAGDKDVALSIYKKAEAQVTTGKEPLHQMDLAELRAKIKDLEK